MAKTYKYKVFPLDSVEKFLQPMNEDAFFAEELHGMNKSDWDKALREGYRWIRSENDFAILELETADEE